MNNALSQRSSAAKNVTSKLQGYRRIVLLTEGSSDPFLAKTAISMLRYRGDHVVAVYDSGQTKNVAQDLFNTGGQTPFVGSLDGLNADAVFLGTAAPGGKLPAQWRGILIDALQRGIDIVSGTHEFLSDDPDFSRIAADHGSSLIDVRQNDERSIATGKPFRQECLRVHAVGQDCSLGKMVVSLEVQKQLTNDGFDAQFVATGQTGIMIAGDGVPIDCVVSDFVSGAAESLVRRNEGHDILMIEGQGSISHPSYSAVTMGLLHGCAPDGLIYCYEVGRKTVKGLEDFALLPHRRMIDMYEANASLRHPCRVIGIAMNSRKVGEEEAEAERKRMHAEFELPICDVYRDGAGTLADAVLKLRRELNK